MCYGDANPTGVRSEVNEWEMDRSKSITVGVVSDIFFNDNIMHDEFEYCRIQQRTILARGNINYLPTYRGEI